MGKHGHDVYMLILMLFLVLTVTVLSVNQVNPDMTGNVVAENSDFTVDLVKDSVVETDAVVFNSKDKADMVGLITGNVVSEPGYVLEDLGDCAWINQNNEFYSDLKSVTARSACGKMGYDVCVMTNKQETQFYYVSQTGECAGKQLSTEINTFGDCNVKVNYAQNSCESDTYGLAEPLKGDTRTELITSVFCCR